MNYMNYLMLLLLLIPSYGYAEEASSKWSNFRLLQLEKFDIKYAQFKAYSRDPYAPQYTGYWKDRAAIEWRINVLKSLYWDNNMHLETIDAKTVKTVGWHWELGLRLHKKLQIFHEHHSRHILDEPGLELYNGKNQFPVEDSFGIRIKLIDEKVGRGIFK
jgi:hypothetical protein